MSSLILLWTQGDMPVSSYSISTVTGILHFGLEKEQEELVDFYVALTSFTKEQHARDHRNTAFSFIQLFPKHPEPTFRHQLASSVCNS